MPQPYIHWDIADPPDPEALEDPEGRWLQLHLWDPEDPAIQVNPQDPAYRARLLVQLLRWHHAHPEDPLTLEDLLDHEDLSLLSRL